MFTYFINLLINLENIDIHEDLQKQHNELLKLLERIDGPIERVSKDLASFIDGFEGRLLILY